MELWGTNERLETFYKIEVILWDTKGEMGTKVGFWPRRKLSRC